MDMFQPEPTPAAPDPFAMQAAIAEDEAEIGFLRSRNRALARLVLALRARLAQAEGTAEGGTH